MFDLGRPELAKPVIDIKRKATSREVYTKAGRLSQAEVFDAEVYAALQGLAAARAIAPRKHLFVCLDNTSVVDGLTGKPPESSQAIFLRFQTLARNHTPGVTVKWVPGHVDIEGNEAADRLAKQGTKSEPPSQHRASILWVERHIKAQGTKEFDEWWKDRGEPRYRFVGSHAVTRKPLSVYKRGSLHRLLAARTGHGDFADYHKRFRHHDSNNHCSCGKEKSPRHIFYCRKLRKHRLLPGYIPEAAILQFLGEDGEKWVRFVERSEFYRKICPR